MKKILVLLLFPSLAFAHPADDACPPGIDSSGDCQPVVAALHLDNQDFFVARHTYWHCRRNLVTVETMRLGMCVGANQWLSALLGETYQETVMEEAICKYWNVVPSAPEFDKLDTGNIADSITQTNAETDACDLTRAIAAAVSGECEAKRDVLLGRVMKKLRRRR